MVIPLQPTMEGPFAPAFEGEQEGHDFTGVGLHLGVFRVVLHHVIRVAERLYDKIDSGHGMFLSSVVPIPTALRTTPDPVNELKISKRLVLPIRSRISSLRTYPVGAFRSAGATGRVRQSVIL